jgi:hypothetical protein
MLVIDSYGLHLTIKFVNYCYYNNLDNIERHQLVKLVA